MRSDVVLEGLLFGEGPRWHDGRLWFSDFYQKVVRAFDPTDDSVEEIVRVPHGPSGLGWLPDGRLLVVSMANRRVLRLEPDGLVLHADLAEVATGDCNDMVVDVHGRAYVGNFGSDIGAGEALTPASLALVHPDGVVEAAATDLAFPNGCVITPDGGTLIVAETFAERLSAFDVGDNGRLHGRRTWAEVADLHPDGCCLDEDGGMWVANPPARECLRIEEGGRVTHRVQTSRPCIACALGGAAGRTLFLMTSWFSDHESRPEGDCLGVIEAVRAPFAAAGQE